MNKEEFIKRIKDAFAEEKKIAKQSFIHVHKEAINNLKSPWLWFFAVIITIIVVCLGGLEK